MRVHHVVIVSGASRGLGAAVAGCLAESGADLVLVAKTEAALAEITAKIEATGRQPLALGADVSDWGACKRVADTALERFGRIDALVNNAGVVQPLAMTATADPESWQRCVAVNLLGPFHMIRAALDSLRQARGRVVNVSSGAATIALAGAGAYCATKAALNHFSSVLAAEEPEVTTVAVRPGVVDTDMQTELREQPAGGMPAGQVDYYRRLKTERQLEPPEVPGRAIAWLALNAPPEWSGQFISYDNPQIPSL